MDFELIFWLALLICTFVLMILGPSILNLVQEQSDYYIEDLEAWTRNYAKIQKRYN